MPVNTCTHIKVNGVRCDSPALRQQQFCYFHQRIHRSVRFPNSRLHHVAQLESPEAIQASIMEIVNALLRGTIEVKRAELILRALNIAVRNSRRANFEFHSSEMVREVPNFEPEEDANEADVALAQPLTPRHSTHEEIEAVKAAHLANHQKHTVPQAHVDGAGHACVTTNAATPVRVGTAALGRPAGPEVPVRSVLHSNSPAARRKPPVSAKSAPVPKERKNTAQSLS